MSNPCEYFAVILKHFANMTVFVCLLACVPACLLIFSMNYNSPGMKGNQLERKNERKMGLKSEVRF